MDVYEFCNAYREEEDNETDMYVINPVRLKEQYDEVWAGDDSWDEEYAR